MDAQRPAGWRSTISESAADDAVDDLFDLDLDAADHVGLDDDVEVHQAAGLGGQHLLEPLAVPGGQWCRNPDDGNAPPTARRRQLAHVIQRRLEVRPRHPSATCSTT